MSTVVLHPAGETHSDVFDADGGRCFTNEIGTNCYGAAFRLKRSSDGTWRETVIYRFRGPSGGPAGPVFGEAGNLFGTAPGGAFGLAGCFG